MPNFRVSNNVHYRRRRQGRPGLPYVVGSCLTDLLQVRHILSRLSKCLGWHGRSLAVRQVSGSVAGRKRELHNIHTRRMRPWALPLPSSAGRLPTFYGRGVKTPIDSDTAHYSTSKAHGTEDFARKCSGQDNLPVRGDPGLGAVRRRMLAVAGNRGPGPLRLNPLLAGRVQGDA